MKTQSSLSLITGVWVACLLAMTQPTAGSPWKFGIIGDTQWPAAGDSASGYKNPNSVAVDIINQVNKEFIARGVKLVVAVGDITDNGTNLALDTRVTYAQALYNAQVAFFPLRGNHELYNTAAAEFVRIFPQTQTGANNGTPSDAFVYTDSAQTHPVAKTGSAFTVGSGFSSPSTPMKGLSYAFTYNNATFVLLDQFTPADSSANPIDAQQHWIDSVLSHRPAGTHAFVFGHKGLITENHADILFSVDETTGKPSDDTAGANTFIRSLVSNKVHYYMGGHDHIHNRALVATSDTPSASIQDIIIASDSYKFYKPVKPSNDSKYDSTTFGFDRETEIAQDYAQIGYYIVTVDSSRVTIQYFGVPSGQTGGVVTTAPPLTGNWTKRETFGYSLNGKEFQVPQGQPYTAAIDSFGGTKAKILSGANTSTAMDSSGRACIQVVGTGWSSSSATGMYSRVFTLWGMVKALGSGVTPNYTLSMSYDATMPASDAIQGKIGIIALDTMGNWVNAADGNSAGSKRFVLGSALSSDSIGAYGVDTATHTAWAVVNYTSDFAVAGFAITGNASGLQQNRASKSFRVRMSGTRLMLPPAFAGSPVNVELFGLDGRLLYKHTVNGNILDLSAVRKIAGTRELIVKCDAGKMQVVQKLMMY